MEIQGNRPATAMNDWFPAKLLPSYIHMFTWKSVFVVLLINGTGNWTYKNSSLHSTLLIHDRTKEDLGGTKQAATKCPLIMPHSLFFQTASLNSLACQRASAHSVPLIFPYFPPCFFREERRVPMATASWLQATVPVHWLIEKEHRRGWGVSLLHSNQTLAKKRPKPGVNWSYLHPQTLIFLPLCCRTLLLSKMYEDQIHESHCWETCSLISITMVSVGYSQCDIQRQAARNTTAPYVNYYTAESSPWQIPVSADVWLHLDVALLKTVWL